MSQTQTQTQNHGTIKLWSIQTIPACEILRKGGRLYGDGRRISKEYRNAYRWMVNQMRNRGIPINRKTPVWAWHSFDGHHRMPDLRHSAHLPCGTKGVRLHFYAPRPLVLLSDFNGWHDVLNDWPTTRTDAEGDRFERMNPESKHYRKCKIESWNRILENQSDPSNPFADFEDTSWIQAALPYLDFSWVTKIDCFTAR